ncbi:hypothetical protein HDU85_007821 [Gaertneriomyces sp. JEL0708]|nr:hypothetical protein HDU85_007821 [Gaertneriomyces sp. JEL0708]
MTLSRSGQHQLRQQKPKPPPTSENNSPLEWNSASVIRCKHHDGFRAADATLCHHESQEKKSGTLWRRRQHESDLFLTYTQCRSGSDVIQCANQFNSPIAARSGGHSFEAYSLSFGVTVHLGNIIKVQVDQATSTVLIGAGAWLEKIYFDIEGFNLLLPGGNCPAVGIGGHALGGGLRFASREYGLVADNILEMEMVDAQGNILAVYQDENADLFWALRGAGGGHFGIITQFKMLLYEPSAITRGNLEVDLYDAHDIIVTYTGIATTISNDFTMALIVNEASVRREVVVMGDSDYFSQAPFQSGALSTANLLL